MGGPPLKTREVGVLVDIKYDKAKHIAYYFAIPKKDTIARALWN